LHQQGARFDVASDGFAVHRHGYGRHDLPPIFSGPKNPLFRLARCRRRRLGCEIGAISVRMRLGTI
jgi:hypothetical protein